MKGVLAGRTVVELGTMLAAPFAGHLLAQLGAEVIKIEPPAGDPTRTMLRGGPSGTFIAYSRGKKSLCLDLKTAEAQRVFGKLVSQSDIVVHNLSPLSCSRLQVGYEVCRAAKSDIVYCHIQGYGAGPLQDELASNPLIEASTGVMHANRIDGRPTRLGPSYHDQFAGTYAVIGILSALASPSNDERSRLVEVGLYETGLHIAARDLVSSQLKAKLGIVNTPESGSGEFNMPGYGAYETADGRWIYLMMLSDAHWSRFCQAMALPAYGDDTLATVRQRKKRRAEVESMVKAAIKKQTFDAVTRDLKVTGFGFTEVKSAATVLEDDQARQQGKLEAVSFADSDFEVPNFPLPHQAVTNNTELPPPLLGEHTQEILNSLHYEKAECQAMLHSGAIYVSSGERPHWALPKRET